MAFAFCLLSSIMSTSFCKQNLVVFHTWGSGCSCEALCGPDALAWQAHCAQGASLVLQPCVRMGEEWGVSRVRGARRAVLLPSPCPAAGVAVHTLQP